MMRIYFLGKPCLLSTHNVDNTVLSTCQIILQHKLQFVVCAQRSIGRNVVARHVLPTFNCMRWHFTQFVEASCELCIIRRCLKCVENTRHRCPRDVLTGIVLPFCSIDICFSTSKTESRCGHSSIVLVLAAHSLVQYCDSSIHTFCFGHLWVSEALRPPKH